MALNFPTLVKDINYKFKKLQTPKRINMKKTIPRYVLVKLQKIKVKDNSKDFSPRSNMSIKKEKLVQ